MNLLLILSILAFYNKRVDKTPFLKVISIRAKILYLKKISASIKLFQYKKKLVKKDSINFCVRPIL